MDQSVPHTVLVGMMARTDTTPATTRLVNGFVELDGTVSIVKRTVCPMIMTFMDTTRASPVQEERFVFTDGLGLPLKFTARLRTTPWRATPVIQKVKRFACITGMGKTSATCIAKEAIAPSQDTHVTQMETKRVCKTRLVRPVIAHQTITLSEVTAVSGQQGRVSVFQVGLELNVTFSVYQRMTHSVIIFVRRGPEPKNACRTSWRNCTVNCKARNDSMGQHECTVNGSKICSRNWYGPNCDVHCVARNDSGGHFTCNPHSGQRICNPDWYGENCNTSCVP